MENRLSSFEFDNAKVSAFHKYCTIDPNEFNCVTLGPNSIYKNEYSNLHLCDAASKLQPFKVGQCRSRNRQKMDTKPEGEVEGEIKIPHVDKEDEGLPIREIIRDLQTESLKEAVQCAVQKRLDSFNKHCASLEYQSKNRLLVQQQKLIENVRHEEEKIMDMFVEVDASNSSEREKRMKYYQHLAEARRKNIAELVAKEKFNQELNKNIDKTTKIHKEFSTTYIEIANFMKSSVSDEMRIALAEEVMHLKSLLAEMQEVTERCKSPKYNSSDVEKAAEILNSMKVMKERVQTIINHVNNKKNKPVKPDEETQLSNPKTEPVSVSVIQPTSSHKESVKTMTDVTLEKYISRENLRLYSQTQHFLTKHLESLRELSENPSLKQFTFDCKKAVNIPVNALTAVNPYHLRDKYERLYNLLSGKQVEIANNKYLNASKHPQGVAFCVDLLAKKMVLQADLMISSNADSAFCYATIIVALWNVIPEFGQLFLGYLYKGCPYLVPFNVVKSVDQSAEEFYVSQGYQYSDGQIEKQDKYLKRMTGLMRLYSAVIITKPKSGHAHPHGIENGWRWLASILKLEPQLDITATMLHTFLELAGYQMELVYRKAFKKLIQIIILKFMPIMKQNDSGGPATRLEGLLQKYHETGQFEKPCGVLPDDFW